MSTEPAKQDQPPIDGTGIFVPEAGAKYGSRTSRSSTQTPPKRSTLDAATGPDPEGTGVSFCKSRPTPAGPVNNLAGAALNRVRRKLLRSDPPWIMTGPTRKARVFFSQTGRSSADSVNNPGETDLFRSHRRFRLKPS